MVPVPRLCLSKVFRLSTAPCALISLNKSLGASRFMKGNNIDLSQGVGCPKKEGGGAQREDWHVPTQGLP